MRTTYKSTNIQQTPQNVNVGVVQNSNNSLENEEQLKKQYQFLYMQTVEEAELKTSIERSISRVNEGQSTDFKDINSSIHQQPYVVNKKKEKKVLPWIILVLLILAVVGGLLYYFLVVKERQKEEKFNSIQEEVESLYTDSNKTDIKEDITIEYVTDLYNSIDSQDESYSDVLLELTTIEMYLRDKEKLLVYEDVSYDLTTDGLTNNLSFLKEGTLSYTVEGLSTSLNIRVDALISEYNLYISLEEEMLSISDYLNFESSKYYSQIESIQHTINKEYLMSIYNDLLEKQTNALVEQSMQEVISTPTDATPTDATPLDATPQDIIPE